MLAESETGQQKHLRCGIGPAKTARTHPPPRKQHKTTSTTTPQQTHDDAQNHTAKQEHTKGQRNAEKTYHAACRRQFASVSWEASCGTPHMEHVESGMSGDHAESALPSSNVDRLAACRCCACLCFLSVVTKRAEGWETDSQDIELPGTDRQNHRLQMLVCVSVFGITQHMELGRSFDCSENR